MVTRNAAIDAVTANTFVVRFAFATGVPSSRKVDLNVPLRFRTQKVLEPLEPPAPSAADSNQTWLLTKGAALAHMVLVDSAAGAKDFRFSNNAEFSADTKGETKVAGGGGTMLARSCANELAPITLEVQAMLLRELG
ncbi:MAG: hypothetical protein M1830_001073, partial [Pleopsidium flavum]